MHADDFALAVLRIGCAEIRSGLYHGRFLFDEWNGQPCLYLKHTELIRHLQESPSIKDHWQHYRSVTALHLKRAIVAHGLLFSEETERQINGERATHLLALNLARLTEVGIYF
ncbi:hypothetical protein [Paludibacterium yongneupense]|uniref:hypothetical protein n=1 Tax=Paludibacterium yongneupense TaxID=400061 RepID=UPI00041C1B9B|nr:hypothetical protein [Paludibacterium yongneupense]